MPPRTKEELAEAAHNVNGEWLLLAEMAAALSRNAVREAADTAALESLLIHARCLINFCCGDYNGNRDNREIQPRDFLGQNWWPADEDFDRTLRGRLRFINREVQHLSWQRVLDKEALMVSMTLLAHEVSYAMGLFIDELRSQQSEWLETFELQQQFVTQLLPPLDPNAPGTVPHLAPARRQPFAPTTDELAAMCEHVAYEVKHFHQCAALLIRHCNMMDSFRMDDFTNNVVCKRRSKTGALVT